jgi:hypothetical protein
MAQTRTFLPLPPDIAGSDELRPLVERANGWLADQLAGWPTPVTVSWYPVANATSPLVGLRVSDKYATADGQFRSSDFAEHRVFQYQLLPVLNKLIRNALDEIRRRDELDPVTEPDLVTGGTA